MPPTPPAQRRHARLTCLVARVLRVCTVLHLRKPVRPLLAIRFSNATQNFRSATGYAGTYKLNQLVPRCFALYRSLSRKFLVHYKNKAARKPCSVLDNHLSGIRITPNLKRFFRSRRTAFKPSIQSCILPGVAWPVFLNTAGDALTSPLHHRSYFIKAVSSIFSVVLSASSRCPEFLRRPVLGCTDFPHIFMRDYPAALLIEFYHKYFIK